MQVAVTGAAGHLGARLMERFRSAGIACVGIGRGEAPAGMAWRKADLRDSSLAAEALMGIGTVVHAASDPKRPQDEAVVMRSLLEGARAAGASHVAYASIVNVDRNRHFLPYYAAKTDAEALLAASGIAYTIQRIAQFHAFVDQLMEQFAKGPVALLPPGAAFASIDTIAAAERLAELALHEPRGRVADIAGPQTLDVRDVYTTWKRVRNVRKPALSVPLPIAFVRAISHRRLVNDAAERLGTTWEAWLRSKVP